MLDASITKQGSADNTQGRYGDYFGAATDPTCPGLAWVAGEYMDSRQPGYSTYISGISPLTDPCIQPNVNSLSSSLLPFQANKDIIQ